MQGITPVYIPGGDIYKQTMQNSPDASVRELGRRLIIPKTFDQYYELSQAVIDTGLYAQIGLVPNDQVIDTGLYAQIGPVPNEQELLMGTWYRSRDTLSGDHPYGQHLLNKKWPLIKEIIKVFKQLNSFATTD